MLINILVLFVAAVRFVNETRPAPGPFIIASVSVSESKSEKDRERERESENARPFTKTLTGPELGALLRFSR